MGIVFLNGKILLKTVNYPMAATYVALSTNCCCYSCNDFCRPSALPGHVTVIIPTTFHFMVNGYGSQTIRAGTYVLTPEWEGACRYRYNFSTSPAIYLNVDLNAGPGAAGGSPQCSVDVHWGFGIGWCMDWPSGTLSFPQPTHASYTVVWDRMPSTCGYPSDTVPNLTVQT
jgi:hypothetical protein